MLEIGKFAATGSALLRTDHALIFDKDYIIAAIALAATSTPPGQTGGGEKTLFQTRQCSQETEPPDGH